MTPRQARIALSTFVLLAAGVVYNALYMQSDVASGQDCRRGDASGAGVTADHSAAPRPHAHNPRRQNAPPCSSRTRPMPTTRRKTLPDEAGADTIRAIQRELNQRGFGPVASDGIMRPVTRAAIMSYEHDNRLPLHRRGHGRAADASRARRFGHRCACRAPARCSHRMPRRRSSRFSACWRRAAIVRVRRTAASCRDGSGHPRVRAGSGVGAQGPHFRRCRGPAAEQRDPAEGGRGALIRRALPRRGEPCRTTALRGPSFARLRTMMACAADSRARRPRGALLAAAGRLRYASHALEIGNLGQSLHQALPARRCGRRAGAARRCRRGRHLHQGEPARRHRVAVWPSAGGPGRGARRAALGALPRRRSGGRDRRRRLSRSARSRSIPTSGSWPSRTAQAGISSRIG